VPSTPLKPRRLSIADVTGATLWMLGGGDSIATPLPSPLPYKYADGDRRGMPGCDDVLRHGEVVDDGDRALRPVLGLRPPLWPAL
jgi:hypothetical protein